MYVSSIRGWQHGAQHHTYSCGNKWFTTMWWVSGRSQSFSWVCLVYHHVVGEWEVPVLQLGLFGLPRVSGRSQSFSWVCLVYHHVVGEWEVPVLQLGLFGLPRVSGRSQSFSWVCLVYHLVVGEWEVPDLQLTAVVTSGLPPCGCGRSQSFKWFTTMWLWEVPVLQLGLLPAYQWLCWSGVLCLPRAVVLSYPAFTHLVYHPSVWLESANHMDVCVHTPPPPPPPPPHTHTHTHSASEASLHVPQPSLSGV